MPDYQHYQVRIHAPWCDVSGVVYGLAKKCNIGFAFQHNADDKVKRTHVHAYFFDLDLKYDAISARVKKAGYKGNEDFAVTGQCGDDKRPLDVSGAWTYATEKVALRPVWVQNISPATVEELQEGARRFYAQYRDNTTPAASIVVPKKPNKYQQVKEIRANVLCPQFLELSGPDRIKVVRNETISYLRNNCIFADSKRITEYIECVMLELEDDTLLQAVNRRLNWVFFGQK